MQNKMQHVLKREPCHKCELPVFLAERLVHGARLYHRTCMRCARCKSQLTPGNFYETEVDGEFCCETCPDEDTIATAASRNDIDPSESRLSFSNKLALFQMRTAAAVEESGKGLLAKSLSDEQKSKSLKRLTEMYTMHSADEALGREYKSGMDMSRFMSTQLESDSTKTEAHQVEESEDDEDEEDDEEDNEEEVPPCLPSVQPPSRSHEEPSTSASLSVSLTEKPSVATKPSTIAINQTYSLTPSNAFVTPNANHSSPSHQESVDSDIKISNQAAFPTLRQLSNEPVVNVPDDKKNITEDLNEFTTSRLSGVQARLQQFEQVGVEPRKPSDDHQSSNRLNSQRLSSSNKLFDDFPAIPIQSSSITVHQDPVVPVAEHLEASDVLESDEKLSDWQKDPTALDHLKEIAIRQAIAEINEKVEEQELEETAAIAEPPQAIPTPRKRSPKLKAEYVDTAKQTNVATENPKDSSLTHEGAAIKLQAASEKPEVKMRHTPIKSIETEEAQQTKESYPLEFNPFGDDDDAEEITEVPNHAEQSAPNPAKRNSFNPFDSSDDEVELDKLPANSSTAALETNTSRQSLNPFGSDTEEENDPIAQTAQIKRTPVPTPRKITPALSSLHSTPEPTPRPSRSVAITPQNAHTSIGYAENDSPLSRNHHIYGSTSSLASTSSALNTYTRRHKSRAPLPPSVTKLGVVVASHPNTPSPCSSSRTSPSASVRNTPTSTRKKRPAPAPPSANKTNEKRDDQLPTISLSSKDNTSQLYDSQPTASRPPSPSPDNSELHSTKNSVRKLIPLDRSLIESPHSNETNRSSSPPAAEVVYRRTIMPIDIANSPVVPTDNYDRQWQKVKENKESLNKNRQSQGSMSPDGADQTSPSADNETSLYSNKSTHGKWKRRKGPAPSLPVIMGGTSSGHHPRGALQMLPLQDIRYELEVIEVQQQGLEKQGIQLEKMIRERCEGGDIVKPIEELANTPNTKEVEDLILQLFEIVNEKNELFRRQAELMYLRRLHRLEQEQAQIEFDIRMLMAQPESNKTDTDKAREDALIARKVEIVLQRNEVIDCLDADRLREAEEDQSIKLRLELHNARREEELTTPIKLSKKEKKKLRETKKLAKQKKMDADKDADETEVKAVADAASKKKKRIFLF